VDAGADVDVDVEVVVEAQRNSLVYCFAQEYSSRSDDWLLRDVRRKYFGEHQFVCPVNMRSTLMVSVQADCTP